MTHIRSHFYELVPPSTLAESPSGSLPSEPNQAEPPSGSLPSGTTQAEPPSEPNQEEGFHHDTHQRHTRDGNHDTIGSSIQEDREETMGASPTHALQGSQGSMGSSTQGQTRRLNARDNTQTTRETTGRGRKRPNSQPPRDPNQLNIKTMFATQGKTSNS